MPRAGAHNHRFRIVGVALFGEHRFGGAVIPDIHHRLNLYVRALAQGLFHQFICQSTSADRLETGVVFHLRRKRDLSAKGRLFQQQHLLVRTAGINGGGQAGRAGAYNNDVIHSFHLITRGGRQTAARSVHP